MEFKTKLFLHETFENGLDNWWVEGDMDVWVENNKIFVDIDKPGQNLGGSGTVWLKKRHPRNFIISFKSCVISSGIGANNMNLFFCYNHPNGENLISTKDERATGKYSLYHDLNGYIITFLNDYQGEGGKYEDGSTKARIRMRRCPGFELLTEDYSYHCQQNRIYDFKIIKFNNEITLFVDGKQRLQWNDINDPWQEGLIGLRTFQSKLYWEDIKILEII